MDGFQVEIQDMNGVFRLPEAEELRMMDISFCLPLQNFACQEAFPPQGNQADSIQVRGELGGAAFCVEGAIRFPAGFSSEGDTESFPLRGLWKGGESFLFIGQAVFSDNGFCYR